jgi:hypothetical protein
MRGGCVRGIGVFELSEGVEGEKREVDGEMDGIGVNGRLIHSGER